MLFLVRRFYQVSHMEKTAFELSALIALEYPGDAYKAVFKN